MARSVRWREPRTSQVRRPALRHRWREAPPAHRVQRGRAPHARSASSSARTGARSPGSSTWLRTSASPPRRLGEPRGVPRRGRDGLGLAALGESPCKLSQIGDGAVAPRITLSRKAGSGNEPTQSFCAPSRAAIFRSFGMRESLQSGILLPDRAVLRKAGGRIRGGKHDPSGRCETRPSLPEEEPGPALSRA